MSSRHLFVLPSLKITGGNLEVVRLARELQAAGCEVRILSMWKAVNPVDVDGLDVVYLSQKPPSISDMALDVPLMVARTLIMRLRSGVLADAVTFTHYATYLLLPLFMRMHRWHFVQGIEWRFVQPQWRYFLMQVIRIALTKGKVLSANAYLTRELDSYGIDVAAEATIWADPAYFDGSADSQRDFDIVLMVRKGGTKRFDLYDALIRELENTKLRTVIITPDDDIAYQYTDRISYCALRPPLDEMKRIYGSSRLFILLSDHEGFGLPPLEAMGSGCVPICRDAGGVRAYMKEELTDLLVPMDHTVDQILEVAEAILQDSERMESLSTAARRIFLSGVAKAERRIETLKTVGYC